MRVGTVLIACLVGSTVMALQGPVTAQSPDPLCPEGPTATFTFPSIQPDGTDCRTVPNGGEVTWINLDIGTHDPGDGETGDDFSTCFQASHDGGALGFGESYSATFLFNGTHVILQDITGKDGQIVDEERVCSNDPLVKIWHRNAAGDVVIPWICHIHEDRLEGSIVIDVP